MYGRNQCLLVRLVAAAATAATTTLGYPVTLTQNENCKRLQLHHVETVSQISAFLNLLSAIDTHTETCNGSNFSTTV